MSADRIDKKTETTSVETIPFVGRDKELELLKTKLVDIKNGKGKGVKGLWEITGPSGIGKTTLVNEMTRQAGEDGVPVIRVNFRDLDAQTTQHNPLSLVVDMAKQIIPKGAKDPITDRFNDFLRSDPPYNLIKAEVAFIRNQRLSQSPPDWYRKMRDVNASFAGLARSCGIYGPDNHSGGVSVTTDNYRGPIKNHPLLVIFEDVDEMTKESSSWMQRWVMDPLASEPHCIMIAISRYPISWHDWRLGETKNIPLKPFGKE